MRFRGYLYGLGMKRCGKDFQVAHSVILNTIEKLSVGNNVYIANFCSFILNGEIIIGNEVIFGPNCVLSSGNHTFYNGSFRFGKSSEIQVLIADGCWLAANCTIVAGAALPQKSILAAGSVLSKKFDNSNSVYAGTPAKYLKPI
jgi:maltose O-acetyltransferase